MKDYVSVHKVLEVWCLLYSQVLDHYLNGCIFCVYLSLQCVEVGEVVEVGGGLGSGGQVG